MTERNFTVLEMRGLLVVSGADASPAVVQASNTARHSNGATNMVRLPLPAIICGPPLLWMLQHS